MTCWTFAEIIEYASVRIWVGMMVLTLAGCATGPDFQRPRGVELSPMEIIAWRPYPPYAFRRLCLMPFFAPQGMESLGTTLADIYRQGLAQNGVFSASALLGQEAHPRKPSFESREDVGECGLVLTGTIEKFYGGSGGLPTVLEVTVRIFDHQRETPLWEVIQKGRSFPSPDIDLFWNVICGGGAADYRETGRGMARQFAFFLKGQEDPTTGREAPNVEGGQGDGRENR